MADNKHLDASPWADCVADEKWPAYKQIIDEAQGEQIPFALGGAFAVAAHTGRWRGTKDIDFFVVPEDRMQMISVLEQVGLADYYDVKPYDRKWIYRGHKGEVIADIIWSMPNRLTDVTQQWLERSAKIDLLGEQLPVVPVEEMIWTKMFVIQRERSDWPDVFNMLHFSAERIDWRYLIELVGDDYLLLSGLMATFAWLSPDCAADLPGWLWDRLGLRAPHPVQDPEAVMQKHADRLDTRPWFGPTIEEE